MPSSFTRRAAVVWIVAAPVARGAAQGVSAPQQGHTATTNVPVTKVMLFSSDVGYFEHSGIVHGNSTTELWFKTSQINDSRKSTVLQHQDGGRVGTVTYPSQDPLGKTLKSFQVDICPARVRGAPGVGSGAVHD